MRRLLTLGLIAVSLIGCAANALPSEPSEEEGEGNAEVATVAQALTSGCTAYTYDGHSYEFCAGTKDWSTARTYCQSKGMDLLRVDSAAENAFVLSKVAGNSWMGSSDKVTEGTWKWNIGGDTYWANNAAKPGFYTHYALFEPNDLFGEDCGLFYDDGLWNDEVCTVKGNWVCESTSDLCPNDPTKTQPGTCGCGTADTDSDGDGEPDCVDQCPLDAGFAVAGSCGCPSSPKAAGTSCTDSICGGNATCDGAGTCGNPSACKPDTSCTLARRGASVYWLCSNKLNRDTAEQKCASVGMDLAVVDNATEDAFLRGKTTSTGLWLGGKRIATGKWEWQPTHGLFWNNAAPANGRYTGWAPLHPDGPLGDCNYIDGSSLKWQVEVCSLSHAYACERTTDWFSVDASVVPRPASDVDDVTGQTRTIGRIVDEEGVASQFVESEIMLETSSTTTLNAFLQKYGGTVVDTMQFDPDPQDDLETIQQIRLDPTKLAQASTLSGNLAILNADDESSVLRVSTTNALRTLATFAEASVAGYKVELNWAANGGGDSETLTSQDVITGDLHDQPVLPGQFLPGDSPDNPMGWAGFTDFATQHIGVGEAWQSLARVGKLVRNVDIAILDSGYPSRSVLSQYGGDDYPDQTTWLKAGQFIDQYTDYAQDPGWHGLQCAYAAYGKANNHIGGAGPGYPVVQNAYNGTWGNAIWTWKRMVYMLRWLYRNRGNHNLVVSISQSTTRLTKMMTVRFNIAVRRFERSGMLIVASAGNQHFDVDKMGKYGVRERRHTTPCELTGVYCVGGVDFNSFERYKDSNWGNSDVDIWAPWYVWTAATPTNLYPHYFTGTSAATPFVAGIAALVWAADPSLSSDAVKKVLSDTATVVNNASHVTRVVDANAAVDAALRKFGPGLKIKSPANGSTLDYHFAVSASAGTYDAGLAPPTIEWLRNGMVIATGASPSFNYNSFPIGTSALVARATYSNGTVLTDTVSVTRRVPDSLRVVSPAQGQCIAQGRALAIETSPPDPAVAWSWDGSAPFAFGGSTSINFTGIPTGPHTLSASLNDGMSVRTGSVGVRVVDPTLVRNIALNLNPVPDVQVPLNMTFGFNVGWDGDLDPNATLECNPTICSMPFTVTVAVTNQNGDVIGASNGAPIPISTVGKLYVEAYVTTVVDGQPCVIAVDGQTFTATPPLM